MDTWKLLKQPDIKKFINKFDSPNLVVFKNTKQIQRECEQQNWNLLNPAAEIINKVEQKISQVEWLEEKQKLLPEFEIKTCKEVSCDSAPFILQFNRAHTGNGTFLIEDKEDLDPLQQKFPDRPVKISKYIEGDMFTLNCIVSRDQILTSSISYQITGIEPFTTNTFATVGNDWGLADTQLNIKDQQKIKQIGEQVGQKLRIDNFFGLFGIDVIKSSSGEIYLIEINARQPASTTFESHLQIKAEKRNDDKTTTFYAHLLSLLKQNINFNIPEINSGAQIIYRNKQQQQLDVSQARRQLEQAGFQVITYNNNKPNSELMRIMSNKTIFTRPNHFNSRGQKITSILSEAKIS